MKSVVANILNDHTERGDAADGHRRKRNFGLQAFVHEVVAALLRTSKYLIMETAQHGNVQHIATHYLGKETKIYFIGGNYHGYAKNDRQRN